MISRPSFLAIALGLQAAAAMADPDYDSDVPCADDPECQAEFIAPPEPPPLGLSNLLTAPNDGRRPRALLPRREEHAVRRAPRTAPNLPGAYTFGPRLKAELAGTAVDLNLGFERGGDPAHAAPPSDLKYQWQLRAPLLSDLDVGLQGSGEMGPWSQVRPIGETANRYGVTLFGLSRPDGSGLGWQAGYASGSAFGKDGYLFSGSVKYGF